MINPDLACPVKSIFYISPGSGKNKKLVSISILLFTTLLIFTFTLTANNLAVGTVTITDINTTSHYANLQFDISWDNSWRNDITGAGQAVPYNWDAAWVFSKYKVGSGNWNHCTLAETGHTDPTGTPSGVTIDGQSDRMGVFIYRSANGTGTNT